MSKTDVKLIHMTECASGKAAARENTLTGAGSSSDLSHDLRTPLNIIIGFSELLLEEIPGRLNAEQRLDLTDILNSGKRLLKLINPMLERYENGTRPSTGLPDEGRNGPKGGTARRQAQDERII